MLSSVEYWHRFREKAARDFGQARRELIREIELSREFPNTAAVAAALARLRRAFERDVLSKSYAELKASSHSADALLLLVQNDFLEHWFATDKLVVAAQQIVAGARVSDSGELSADALDERLGMAAMLMKIRQERLSNH